MENDYLKNCSTSLVQKIILAESVIHSAYKANDGKLFISFSGGKDSTILRHIALRLYPDLKVVFSNTTNELAEVIRYVKTFPNVITVQPKLNFTEVVEKYGFPLVSKEVSQKVNELKRTHGRTTRLKRFQGDIKGNGKLSNKWRFLAEKEFDVTHKCCSILKKNPLEKWAREEGLKPIIALMEDESRLRQQLSLYGKDDGKKVYPFLRTKWTEEDIWEYAETFGIRFAECYYDRYVNGQLIKARTRTGCEYCAFGITMEKEDRFERSRLSAPKRYEKMMNVSNNGVTFREVIDMVKNNDNKPNLDLYGVKLSKKTTFTTDTESLCEVAHVDSTTIVKKCPCCGSKNISNDFGHYGNYPDTPDPITGEHRKVFVESKNGYTCNDCNSTIIDDLHMFNVELGITNRLMDYIKENFNKMSFNTLMNNTGLDFDEAYNIAKKLN